MNKSIGIAVAVTVVLIIALVGVLYSSGNLPIQTTTTPTTNESNASFYELAYAKATSEQKEELDKIIDDKSIGLPGEWRRAVLIAIGDLPKDTPRLSAEQAAKLFDGKEISDLESEFNKIAGAPDFVGGSGIQRSIYFLKDDRSEAIILMLDDVFHIVYNDDGTEIRLPVGTQKLPSDPGTSLSPSLSPTQQPTVTILLPQNDSFFNVSLGGVYYQLTYETNSTLSWVD